MKTTQTILLCLITFLFSPEFALGRELNCKDRFEVNFTHFDIQPYTPLTEESFGATGKPSFLESNCELLELFKSAAFKEKKKDGDLRIRIFDTMTKEKIYITSDENLIKDGTEFELTTEQRGKLVGPLRDFGTKRAAKRRYDQVCRKKMQKSKKAICAILKQGRFPTREEQRQWTEKHKL